MGVRLGRAGERRSLADINVTPLVDVMLVLLVIFMITAPVIQSGIQVDVPHTKGTRSLSQNLTVVTVDRSGNIYINDKLTTFKTLAADVAAAMKQSGPGAGQDVYIRADGRLNWDTLATVMDRLQTAGVAKVNMVTQPCDNCAPATPK